MERKPFSNIDIENTPPIKTKLPEIMKTEDLP